jgi:protein phosphatase
MTGLFVCIAVVLAVAVILIRLLPYQTTLRVGIVSLRGKVRETNEDNFFVPGRAPVRPDQSDGSGVFPMLTLEACNLFIVADGMGGQQAGEKASLMAVELIPEAISKRLSKEVGDPRQVQTAIREAVAEANSEIMRVSGLFAEYSHMGTTVVLAQFHRGRVYVVGIGDSRAYLLRDGHLEQLTKDHSLADALFATGTITDEELKNHRFKNVLYKYLGSNEAQDGPEECRILNVRRGDRLLLATDGLTGAVADEDLARVLGTVDDPQQAAGMLADLALHNDSKDNVTCLTVYVETRNAGTARAS